MYGGNTPSDSIFSRFQSYNAGHGVLLANESSNFSSRFNCGLGCSGSAMEHCARVLIWIASYSIFIGSFPPTPVLYFTLAWLGVNMTCSLVIGVWHCSVKRRSNSNGSSRGSAHVSPGGAEAQASAGAWPPRVGRLGQMTTGRPGDPEIPIALGVCASLGVLSYALMFAHGFCFGLSQIGRRLAS